MTTRKLLSECALLAIQIDEKKAIREDCERFRQYLTILFTQRSYPGTWEILKEVEKEQCARWLTILSSLSQKNSTEKTMARPKLRASAGLKAVVKQVDIMPASDEELEKKFLVMGAQGEKKESVAAQTKRKPISISDFLDSLSVPGIQYGFTLAKIKRASLEKICKTLLSKKSPECFRRCALNLRRRIEKKVLPLGIAEHVLGIAAYHNPSLRPYKEEIGQLLQKQIEDTGVTTSDTSLD